MSPNRFLLCVCILGLIAGGAAKVQYALTIPALLKSGETQRACVNLIGYHQPLALSVVLEHQRVNISIFSEKVQPPHYFKCNKFMVPTVITNAPDFVTLSVSGGGEDIKDRKAVVIAPLNTICLIQMDKPVYKPGCKVRFRLISLNTMLLPISEKYTAVYLEDPSGSRIAQWQNQESVGGVVQLEFPLISDAAPGSYTITAEGESCESARQGFTVDEYILPRFSVIVDPPNTISILDDILTLNVSAIYTYGQPVPGSVTIKCCREASSYYGRKGNCFKGNRGICTNITGELGPDGAFYGVVSLLPFQMGQSGFQMSLGVALTVTEEGTGIQVTHQFFIMITSQLATLIFDYDALKEFYKRGIPYLVKVILTDANDNPMANEQVEVELAGKTIGAVLTDKEGRAEYAIDTSSFVQENFTVVVSYENPHQCYYTEWEGPDFPTAQHFVMRFYSETGSFLDIQGSSVELNCGQVHNISVRYILSLDGMGEGATTATFYYLAMSRAKIVQHGQRDVHLNQSKSGLFNIGLNVTSDLAPGAELIVYCILDLELIADTISLDIEKCFQNQVSLSFSDDLGPTASNVSLNLSAAPGSLCGVKVIDSSLLLINPYESLSASGVYYSIPYLSLFGYNYGGFNLEEPEPPCEDPNTVIFCKGRYYLPVSSSTEGDTYQNLRRVGLVLGTSSKIRKPVVCGMEAKFSVPRKSSGESDFGSSLSNGHVETLRKNFSETFLWRLVSVDSEGQNTITETVPDTITKWQGSMFCVSEKEGFGITKYSANFTSFLPFFVELSLPYSLTREEILVMKAFVSNYLEECIKIIVTLQPSADFEVIPQDVKQDQCICSGGRSSYSWNIIASSLGRISFIVSAETTHIGASCDGPSDQSQSTRKDTVIQTILVQPEGIRKEETSSNLVCVEDSNVEMPINLTLPENIVQGSASAFVTFVGDVLGLPLSNLQNLLQMPYGCGEQNLARMAPIPYVLEYLNNTNQLTDELLQTAVQFLNEGYYRQLRYKLPSGAYDAFWSSPSDGSSWLSAYTFKTFEKAKKYIYVDGKIQQQTLLYLQTSQKLDNGCFKAEGNLFMRQCGQERDLCFTAYLAIALLESNYSSGMTLLDDALGCLEAAMSSASTLYFKSYTVYVFTLVQNWEIRNTLLNELKSKVVSERGTLHWEREDKLGQEGIPLYYPNYSPAEVEITAYMLLSIAKGSDPTHDDLTYMAQISVWLIQQQNSYGGFRSTQDTVVALQALAFYAQLLFKSNAHHNVFLRSEYGDVGQLNLSEHNRLVVQRLQLPEVSGNYSISINGTGCCLVQSTIRYNIPVPKENSAFYVAADSVSKNCLNGVAYTITITVSVSYRGLRNETNMVIIDIQMLSGYQADYPSLRQLENSQQVSKTEEQDNHVFLYLNAVPLKTIQLSFKVLIGSRVLNVKSASVYVYDYYETGENGFASYSQPC
ncbi:uncharacterized protein LOC431886 isoform X1 [Xenopus laevis]|uniref:Uncharacterized protein LOC431886 isoform X1 n=2 Tax=Xenopus laevis TaxID=8355 RepID=A0A1L8FIE8_XENLA|nr:uncharacterized protein LOC431886 isoform X1 [Xenopus laevis]XP_018079933.1 uncharacterized protein LOC431886 isoform X1 [Xenopus laevis]XP_018079934.1 uncharacterized protein LOC431886 isoform X1 [Xenopus laevis]XP_018079935.1 uncharacterized protein LOC431886 isoform X1 [Xenopus laevis]XP_041424395.1 uncharacterized protein LOC431886 isoform X1 [Xenopus laevis]XP_041424396.1 uncharacterized protein LOC431886 isoform X1 [Xenopus laevis]7S62_A Chain A, Alpha 2-macroglobulin [Xenopus laevis